MAKDKQGSKDAYYFPHFCNARHDRKIKRVRKELGMEGYGIFFMLLEILREQADFRYPVEDIDLLADELETSEQKVRTVISNYGLFQVDNNDKFFSSNLILYLMPYLEQKKNNTIAAYKRWGKTDQIEEIENRFNADVMHLHSDRNAPVMLREDIIREDIILNNNKDNTENSSISSSIPFEKYNPENQKITEKPRNTKTIFSEITKYWNEKVPAQATPFTSLNMSLSGDIITLLEKTDISVIKTAIDHYGQAYDHNKYRVAGFTNFMTIKNVESWFPESSVENRKGKEEKEKEEEPVYKPGSIKWD